MRSHDVILGGIGTLVESLIEERIPEIISVDEILLQIQVGRVRTHSFGQK